MVEKTGLIRRQKGVILEKVRLSFDLSRSIAEELDFMADELKLSKSAIVEKALDYYFLCVGEKIAIKEAEKLKEGKAELFSFSDVVNDLDNKDKKGS